MVKFIEQNSLLCDNQHGFRSGRSCLTQLLSHIDDVTRGLINGADTDAIYLDYAKAFDKVDHQLLIAVMDSMNTLCCGSNPSLHIVHSMSLSMA